MNEESEAEIEDIVQSEVQDNEQTEVEDEIIETEVEPVPVVLSKITYDMQEDEGIQGKEAYAIGIYNHSYFNYAGSPTGSLLLNSSTTSVFGLDISHCDSDVVPGDVVRVEGVFEFKDRNGTFSQAVITKASPSEISAFTSERNVLKNKDLYVYAMDCQFAADYESLLRGGQDWLGKDIGFEGKVTQVLYDTGWTNDLFNMLQDGTYCNIIIDINAWHNEPKYIVCEYVIPEGASRFLEGDSISVYGNFTGLAQMEMAFGPPESFPVMDVKLARITVG